MEEEQRPGGPPDAELEGRPTTKESQCGIENRGYEEESGSSKKAKEVKNANVGRSKTSSGVFSECATSQFRDYLNYGEEDQMEIEGYARSTKRTVITWVFIFCTAGILRLIFHWWPQLMLYATHRRCRIADAEKILVIEDYQQKLKRYHVKAVFTLSSDLFSTSESDNTSVLDGESKTEKQRTKHKETIGVENPEASLKTNGQTRRQMPLFSPKDNSGTFPDNSESLTSPAKSFKKLMALWFQRILYPLYIFRHSDQSRTTKLFAAAGLPPDQIHESSNTWDQRLEQELQSIDSPKLAIPKSDGNIREVHSVRVFTCKKLRYLWDDQYGAFVKLQGFDQATTQALHQNTGLSIFEQCQRRLIYGSNEIPVVVQGVLQLLFLEVLNPFYVFQIFSVTLWFNNNYMLYACAIILMSTFGITSTIIQTRQNQRKLQTTVQSSDIVTVCRSAGVYESIPTECLVPGDVIVIPPHGCTMHCDAALLSGNCIVNESMLTGESVPVTKTPLPNRDDLTYSNKEHMRHTLYCGTNILQTRYYGQQVVLAVILRTGFLTAKGSLVRSILYPPPVDHKFERDSYKFVAVLALIAAIGFIFSIYIKLSLGEPIRSIIIDSLELITIAVPPALPAAMTVGRLYAQRRLQQKEIYCISPRAINVSGSINCVCFDKTGTLTEEGLDLWGAVPTTIGLGLEGGVCGEFQAPVRLSNHLSHGPLFIGMAVCHSLTLIDGSLIGDPLDLKMFEWTGWVLEEPVVADSEKFDIIGPTTVRTPRREVNDNVPAANSKQEGDSESVVAEVGIVRQFPFSSSLQRMSVITRTLGGSDFELFCKGSPEMITSLSTPQSVPENFSAVLERYTQQGYRVIAIAHKFLARQNYAKVQRVMREEVEFDLTFLGLIVLENRLKPETTGVIGVLRNAHIRTIMVTGDNMLTAISVARECGMVESDDKVIVIGAEPVDSGLVSKDDKAPKLSFYLANKSESTLDMSGSQNPVSILNGQGDCTDGNLFDVESPLNRYHFAVTGNSFAVVKGHYPELLPKILVRGAVFARMSPDQKQQLVEQLQALGYFVGMCGDGANDCGALKAAHAGISLSEAESSVASPFTSKEANITCVPKLIREGRAALVTSFGIFKYMAVYSLTQFCSVIILYTIACNLSDLQYLYIDLFLISEFALFFGHTKPFEGQLVKDPPSASLVSLAPVLSILLHIGTIVGIQNLAFLYVQTQTWFTPFDAEVKREDGKEFASYENYSLFSVSCFQYIIMAIVFSQGAPYRKSLLTNPGLLGSLVLMTSFTIYLVLWPFEKLQYYLDLKLPEDFSFRVTLLGFAFVNLIIALFIECFIINFMLTRSLNLGKYIQFWKIGQNTSKKAYLQIERELSLRTDWPSVSSTPNYSITNSPAREASPGNGNAVGDALKKRSVRDLNNIALSSLRSENRHHVTTDELSRTSPTALSIPIPMIDYSSNPQPRNLDSYVVDAHTTNSSSDSADNNNAHLELELMRQQHNNVLSP